MTVLKGGISYTEGEGNYVWHSTNNACDACQALNGATFSSIDNIPDKPHPNCRCWIEDKEEKEQEDKNNILEEIRADIYSLKEEIDETIYSLHNRSMTKPQEARLFGEYVEDLRGLKDDCNSLLNETSVDVENMPNEQIENLANNILSELNSINEQFKTIYSALNKEIKNIEQQNKIDDNFKNDFQKHDELKQLLQNHHDGGATPLPEGYDLIQTIHDTQTELDIEIFEHGNELILSFPGSESLQDYEIDLKDILQNHKNPQLDKAQEVLNDIKSNPQYQDHKITTTGYSLGGNIAGGLSVLNDIEGVTFNPYGNLNDILQQKANDLNQTIEINPNKLVNYRHENDGLSKWEHVGTNYEFLNDLTGLNSNPKQAHDIKNLNDTKNRLPNETIYHDKTIYYPKSKLNK